MFQPLVHLEEDYDRGARKERKIFLINDQWLTGCCGIL